MDIDNKWSQRKEQFYKLWPQKYKHKIDIIWNTLTQHYSEETRFYHTREHILKCLQHFDHVKNFLSSSDAVQLSIWFHDIIYDIKAKDNEEQSALYFSQIAQGLLPDKLIKLVTELIVSTKHLTSPPDCDQAFLLDIDLCSFGENWEKFNSDGQNLRKEAAHLTDEQVNNNKIIFFQMLLKRKQIFFTDYFHDKYEDIALNNINLEMNILLKNN